MCGSCFFGLAQYMGYIDGNIFINVAVSGKFIYAFLFKKEKIYI